LSQGPEGWYGKHDSTEGTRAKWQAGVALDLDTDLAAWIGSLSDVSHERLVQVGLAEPRDSSKPELITVARLTDTFVERSAGKPATIRGFQQTLNSVVGLAQEESFSSRQARFPGEPHPRTLRSSRNDSRRAGLLLVGRMEVGGWTRAVFRPPLSDGDW
jgi:hypothetical protein